MMYCRVPEYKSNPVISPAPKSSISTKKVLKAFSCDCGSRGGIRWSNAPWQMSVCRAEGRGTVRRAQRHHSLSSQYQLVLHDSNQCGGAKQFHHTRPWPVTIHTRAHAHTHRRTENKKESARQTQTSSINPVTQTDTHTVKSRDSSKPNKRAGRPPHPPHIARYRQPI